MKCFLYLLVLFYCYNPLAIAAKGELIVAIFIEPPFADLVNNELVGERIDTARLLAKSVNLKPIFIRCPFARCLTMVKHGQAYIVISKHSKIKCDEDRLSKQLQSFVTDGTIKAIRMKSYN